MNAWFALAIPFGVLIVLTGALLCWMPRLTRPELYFAVTVPADFPNSAEGERILRRYRAVVIVSTLIGLALVSVGGTRRSLALPLVGLALQSAGCLAAYFRARAQVAPHAVPPDTNRNAEPSSPAARIPGGWPVSAGPFVVLAAAAIYLNHRWEDIPERFPIHWGVDGQPNGWSTHTVAGVYGPLFIGAAACLTLMGVAYALLRWSRPIQTSGQAGSAEADFRSTVAGILVGVQYLLAAVFAWTAILPLRSNSSDSPEAWVIFVPTLAFVVVTTALLIRKGQGGMRALRSTPDSDLGVTKQPVGDRTEDRYWKGGFLYVNSGDPSLFVEKRFGIGYTLNFGHKGSWMILACVLLLPLLVALVIKLGSH